MSKFKTSIPVDLESVKRLLPPGHYLHGVTFDASTSEVSVVWEHDKLLSGRDFPVAFPVGNLQEQKTPEGIRFYQPPKLVTKAATKAAAANPPNVAAEGPVLSEEAAHARLHAAGRALAEADRPLPADAIEPLRKGYEERQAERQAIINAMPKPTAPAEAEEQKPGPVPEAAPEPVPAAAEAESGAAAVPAAEAAVATPPGVVPTEGQETVARRKGRR